ncbi:UDP-glucose 4-epimerase GalE [Roseomonas marmotae]|uniref:UDP-glucose 4-epimerase GalE n=1 Tax=Roseomonas marmotae TaxID=2768161 RepID=UPI001F02E6EF|nr:UDP-glucose 4-epimerase GalE [Roseomonas marmotae]
MARFLVSGGAGYVGSHVVLALLRRGDDVVVIDNLCQGHRAAVPDEAEFIHLDLAERKDVAAVFASGRFDGVLHFAALSLVGESMREPMRYIAENVSNTAWLIDAAARAGCLRFVLSSTAALFGYPERTPIDEYSRIDPVSAYGESKLMAERALDWAERIHAVRSASLRYFNAAGADPDGSIGEDHDPETHLIPLAIKAALGLAPPLTVHGTDYLTPDGTCIRDYVHVADLADAHLRVLEYLRHGQSCRFNIGGGKGHSVREVMQAVERIGGRPVPHRSGPRRPGDPPVLVASSERLRQETGWTPRHSGLDDIIRTAWAWHSGHPRGFGDKGRDCVRAAAPGSEKILELWGRDAAATPTYNGTATLAQGGKG